MQKSIDIKEVAEALVEEHGARMTRNHKSQFREFVVKIAEDMGYDATVENCFLAKNVVVGNPKTAEIVLTAHYDTPPNMPMSFVKKQLVGMGIGVPCVVGTGLYATDYALKNCDPETVSRILDVVSHFDLIPMAATVACAGIGLYSLGLAGGENKSNYDDNSSGVLTVISLMEYYKNLPPEEKQKIAFVFFDNEEKGLVGSLCHRAKHARFKCVKNQNYINFDCVGVGKRVNLIYTGKEQKEVVKKLASVFESQKDSEFSLKLQKSTINTMSDHLSFSGAKGNVTILCDDENDKITNHIHSKKDALLRLENIGAISRLSAETIDDMLGFDEKTKSKLNKTVFDVSGDLVPEKQR